MNRAQHVVNRLLELDFSDADETRPGGPKDPFRQVGIKIDTNKFDYTGKRGNKPAAPTKAEDDTDEDKPEPKPKSRFNISFGETLNQARRIIKRPKTVYENVCPHCDQVIQEKSMYSESFDAPSRHSCGGIVEFEPVNPASVAAWLRPYLKQS